MKLENKMKVVSIGIALAAMPILVFGATTNSEYQKLLRDREQKRQEIMQEIQKTQQEFKNNAQQRIDALKKHFSEVRAKRIDQFFNNMVTKMENAIDRLNFNFDRISKYLDKLAGEGKDVAAFKTQLDAAMAKMQGAVDAINDAKTKFGAMTTSTDPKRAFKDVRTLIGNAEKKIKDAHRALVGVVKLIKGSSGTATTTSE